MNYLGRFFTNPRGACLKSSPRLRDQRKLMGKLAETEVQNMFVIWVGGEGNCGEMRHTVVWCVDVPLRYSEGFPGASLKISENVILGAMGNIYREGHTLFAKSMIK